MKGILITAAWLALSGSAAGQPGPGMCPRSGQLADRFRVFDAKNVVMVAGDVTSIGPASGANGMHGTSLWARTTDGDIEVFLGPDWFVAEQKLQLSVGDRIEARGSSVDTPRIHGLIAIEVRRGADVMKLREETGVPLWAKGRDGRGPREGCPRYPRTQRS